MESGTLLLASLPVLRPAVLTAGPNLLHPPMSSSGPLSIEPSGSLTTNDISILLLKFHFFYY